MTFPIMLSVTLLSMLMILLSILSLIGQLISGNNMNWLLNLSLIYEMLWTGQEVACWLLMWKWMGLFLRVNHLLRCRGWPSLLNWIRALTLSLLLKLPPRKLDGALTHSMMFLSPEVALYLYNSIRPYMKYCCPVWSVSLVATRNC